MESRKKYSRNKYLKNGRDLCIICGRKGGNSIEVTNHHSFVTASGTLLSNFIIKAIGEEPCYAISEVICQQCYILLDRLDAYQERASEILNHITTRYKETKLELMGYRQKMSDLIASSLANIHEMRNGTILNINDGLTITVMRENKNKKRNCASNENDFKFSKDLAKSFLKKPKNEATFNGQKPKFCNLNNNSIIYSSAVQNLANSELSSFVKNKSKTLSNNDNSESDSNSSDSTTSTSSEDSSTSDSDEEDDDDDGSDAEVIHNGKKKEEAKEYVKNVIQLSDNKDKCEIKQDQDSNVPMKDVTTKETQEALCNVFPDPADIQQEVTEAVLMQNSVASSLLQSFLSSSLWFNSSETSNVNKSSNRQNSTNQGYEDLTCDVLNMTAGSSHDKKKRQELKNTGQSYINTKGKLVEAKRVWPQDCSRCLLKCNSRISEEERQTIFAHYWGLADYNKQREYLAAHMQREEKTGPSGLPRNIILYFLSVDNEKLQVCRQFFLKTLDVSEKASRIVLEKKLKGEITGENINAASCEELQELPQQSSDNEK